jgi:hypothetical protein
MVAPGRTGRPQTAAGRRCPPFRAGTPRSFSHAAIPLTGPGCVLFFPRVAAFELKYPIGHAAHFACFVTAVRCRRGRMEFTDDDSGSPATLCRVTACRRLSNPYRGVPPAHPPLTRTTHLVPWSASPWILSALCAAPRRMRSVTGSIVLFGVKVPSEHGAIVIARVNSSRTSGIAPFGCRREKRDRRTQRSHVPCPRGSRREAARTPHVPRSGRNRRHRYSGGGLRSHTPVRVPCPRGLVLRPGTGLRIVELSLRLTRIPCCNAA